MVQVCLPKVGDKTLHDSGPPGVCSDTPAVAQVAQNKEQGVTQQSKTCMVVAMVILTVVLPCSNTK